MIIDVVHDTEGVRMALEEIFEEDFVRSRVQRDSGGADDRTRQRLQMQIPLRTLSPGYYEYAAHLLHLDDERKAGIAFRSGELAAFEVRGLIALGAARAGFENHHPPCTACGTRQPNRYGRECTGCHAKFAGWGK